MTEKERGLEPRPCACGITKEGETTTHPAGNSITHTAYPGDCTASSLSSAGPEQVEEHDRAERLTYCLLARGSENHQDHNVPGCPVGEPSGRQGE